MKMLNLTLEQTMQILAVLICNVNFWLNEFIPTLKNTCFGPKKMMKTFLPAVLENTEKTSSCFITIFHNYGVASPVFFNFCLLAYLE